MKLKFLYSISFLLLFAQCKKTISNQTHVEIKTEKTIVIDSVTVNKNDLKLNQLEGKWYYKQLPFNGYSLKYYPNGKLEEKLGFYNGKREGVAKRWSENGVLRLESHYDKNKLVGSYKTWWENGALASEATYVDGNMQGIVKKWYPSGQIAKERRLVNGKEDGLQKAWLKNGKLYVNYEAKNGRIFGMRRANSCYQLKDEVVVQTKKK